MPALMPCMSGLCALFSKPRLRVKGHVLSLGWSSRRREGRPRHHLPCDLSTLATAYRLCRMNDQTRSRVVWEVRYKWCRGQGGIVIGIVCTTLEAKLSRLTIGISRSVLRLHASCKNTGNEALNSVFDTYQRSCPQKRLGLLRNTMKPGPDWPL